MLPGWLSMDSAIRFQDALHLMSVIFLGAAVIVELVAYFISAERLRHRFEFLGIVLFFVPLVITEPIAYVYERRVRSLATEKNELQQQQITELKQQLQIAQSTSSTTSQELEAEKVAHANEERTRRTPPSLDAYLVPTGRGKVNIEIKSENLIPFAYRYVLVTEKNVIVSGFPVSMARAYPEKGKSLMYIPADIQLNRVTNGYLELRFTFESVYADEFHLPAREIVRKYRIDADQASLKPIP